MCARGGSGQDDGGGRRQIFFAVVFADGVNVQARLVGQFNDLQQIAQRSGRVLSGAGNGVSADIDKIIQP